MEIIILGIIISVVWGLITRGGSGATRTRNRYYDHNNAQDDTWMHHNIHQNSGFDSGADVSHFHSCDCDTSGFDCGCDSGGFDGGCDCGGTD